MLYFTFLSLHLLFYLMFSFLQKIKWECMECRWHGAWHSVSAQTYEFPWSLRISPSERWMAMTRWVKSVELSTAAAPSGSMSASSMQKTLRALWSQKREGAWVEEICPLTALGCYMNEKVPLVRTLKLWNLFVLAASIMLNNLPPSSTDHISRLQRPKCLAARPPSRPQRSTKEALSLSLPAISNQGKKSGWNSLFFITFHSWS